ncbi:MAG: hypothetical protein FJ096_19795 [Deltaproteobacteria bacterium]|nr:hypothetical protein [Deltaproteobacteria bacterium]
MRAASFGFVGLAALSLAAACGSSARERGAQQQLTTNASASSASTGMGGAGGAAVSVGTGFGEVCNPTCKPGEFCSITGTCIPEGTCADDADCGDSLLCDVPNATCVPGGACGKFEVKIQPVQPNLLIVLDRSCSMQSPAGGSSRWTVAVSALLNLMTIHKGKFRFGFTAFPDLDQDGCTQTPLPFPPAPDQENTIGGLLFNSLNFIDPVFPKGPACVTNIDTAVLQAKNEPKLYDPDRDNYVMLVTDGAQSPVCNAAGGDTGSLQMITEMLAAKIKTFVIGFGGQGIDIDALNSFANAGGTPVMNAPVSFYDAADGAALDKALASIASLTLSCTFSLASAPEDPNKLSVFLQNDPTAIPRDPNHLTGWDYDASTNEVTFYGPTCDLIKGGTITDIDIVYGCDVPTPD